MEEDIKKGLGQKSKNKLLESRLDEAITKADQIINFESAHDIELLQALDIVKNFIIRKKRICYGGTAMNALLPKKDKFYDPNYDIPDYDFITDNGENDVKELVDDLERSGFKDVYTKMGIHKGTMKVLVNYVPIADITKIDESTYKSFFEQTKKIHNMYYANENILRMMMYLEMSRPRGEVERWKKVYQRIELINSYFPLKPCAKKHYKKDVPKDLRELIYKYVILHKRVLANIDLESIYKQSLHTKKMEFNIHMNGGNIVFYTPDIKYDAENLKKILGLPDIKIIFHPSRGEFLANRITLLHNNIPLALLVEETACHSYNNIKTNEKGKIVRIASLETLITLHYSLYFLSKSEKTYLCDIAKCIDTLSKLVISNTSIFKPFPTDCTGYQKGYPTLLREKVSRIQEEKNKLKGKTLKKKNSSLKKNEY